MAAATVCPIRNLNLSADHATDDRSGRNSSFSMSKHKLFTTRSKPTSEWEMLLQIWKCQLFSFWWAFCLNMIICDGVPPQSKQTGKSKEKPFFRRIFPDVMLDLLVYILYLCLFLGCSAVLFGVLEVELCGYIQAVSMISLLPMEGSISFHGKGHRRKQESWISTKGPTYAAGDDWEKYWYTSLGKISNKKMQYSRPGSPHTPPIRNMDGDLEMGRLSSSDDVGGSSRNPTGTPPTSPARSSSLIEEGSGNGGSGGSGNGNGGDGTKKTEQSTGSDIQTPEEKERRSFITALLAGSLVITAMALTASFLTFSRPSASNKIVLWVILCPQISAVFVICVYITRCHPAGMSRQRIFSTGVVLFFSGIITVLGYMVFYTVR